MNEDTLKLFMAGAQHGAARDLQWLQGFQLYAINEDDEPLREILAEDVRGRAEFGILQPHPFRVSNPLARDGVDGEVRIGMVEETGAVYGIPASQLTSHLLILGRSGGGKTNILLLMLLQICGHES